MNRKDFFFQQKVRASELDSAFDDVEDALASFLKGFGYFGVATGAEVTQNSPTNLTVVAAGPAIIYDQNQKHIAWFPNQVVNCALDEDNASTTVTGSGNERWLSVFAQFDEVLSDPRVDGNGDTVYHSRAESFKINVVQGAEGVSAVRPPLRGDQILLADVKRTYGQTAIVNADIDTTRSQFAFAIEGSPHSFKARGLQDVLQQMADLVNESGEATNLHVDAIADSPYSLSEGNALEVLTEMLGHVNALSDIVNGGPDTARVRILPNELFCSDRAEGELPGWFYNAFNTDEAHAPFWQSEGSSAKGAIPFVGIGSGSILTAVKACVEPAGATAMHFHFKQWKADLDGSPTYYMNADDLVSVTSSGTALQVLSCTIPSIEVDNTAWQYRAYVKAGQVGDKIWWFAAYFTDKGARNY